MTLPETLVVGKGCFFATGNILTSVDVDQGKFNVPCITYMSPSAEVLSDFFSIFIVDIVVSSHSLRAHQPLHIWEDFIGSCESKVITPSLEITTTCRRVCLRAASAVSVLGFEEAH